MQQLLAILGDLEDPPPPRPLGARQVLAPLVDPIRELEAKLAEPDRRAEPQRPDLPPADRGARGRPGPRSRPQCPMPGRSARAAAWWPTIGGQPRPLGPSKRGDAHRRRQLLYGAGAVVRVAKRHDGRLWTWIEGLPARRPFNVVVAAVANELTRAMLARGEPHRAAA